VESVWLCEDLEIKNPNCEAVAYSMAPSQIVDDACEGNYKILLQKDKSWNQYASSGHRE